MKEKVSVNLEDLNTLQKNVTKIVEAITNYRWH